jgi:hypothetical protein
MGTHPDSARRRVHVWSRFDHGNLRSVPAESLHIEVYRLSYTPLRAENLMRPVSKTALPWCQVVVLASAYDTVEYILVEYKYDTGLRLPRRYEYDWIWIQYDMIWIWYGVLVFKYIWIWPSSCFGHPKPHRHRSEYEIPPSGLESSVWYINSAADPLAAARCSACRSLNHTCPSQSRDGYIESWVLTSLAAFTPQSLHAFNFVQISSTLRRFFIGFKTVFTPKTLHICRPKIMAEEELNFLMSSTCHQAGHDLGLRRDHRIRWIPGQVSLHYIETSHWTRDGS